MPGLTALALLYVVATWAVVIGVGEIVAAVRLRREISGEWLLASAGALSVLLGGLLFAFPVTAGLVLVQWMGAYWAVFGVVLIALAFRLRNRARTVLGERDGLWGGTRLADASGLPKRGTP
jgi:uncharacterized membrane protein HdeD (DUF308 family)